MTDDPRLAPEDWDFGGGWAEIESSRFGYWITAGYGSSAYEKSWFRITHRGATRRARRLVAQANREHERHERRERFT